MKISIAMATYNGEKYLQEQLDSFLNQTVLPDELIVCDDCSKDSTLEILQSFKTNAPFDVTIIRNEQNIGSTKSFEKACKIATGDWVFFSDQDDVWVENKIEEFLKVFDSEDSVGLVYSDYEIVDENLDPILNWAGPLPDYKNPILQSENACEFLLQNTVLCGATMAVKHEIIIHAMPFCDKYHDSWLALVASIRHKLRFLDKKLIKYRQHSKQQIGLGITKRASDKEKSFLQKYFYDSEKYTRRMGPKLKYLYEKVNATKAFLGLLKQQKNINPKRIEIVERKRNFYQIRLTCSKIARLKRFSKLLLLFLKGEYKYWEPHRAFSEFRRDIVFPMIKEE